MLENNKYEIYWQRASRNKIVSTAIILSLLLALEIFAVAMQVAWSIGHNKRNTEVILNRYYLTKVFIWPLIQGKSTSSKEFIGNLTEMEGEWRKLYPADSLLGFRAGKDIIASHHGKYLFITNSQGFFSIGEEDFSYALPKPEKIYRVIVIGGSTVQGDGAPTPADNLPAQIRSALQKRIPTGKSLEVINAGVGGYHSAGELLYFASELINYSPDLVIVYDGWNDETYQNRDLMENPNSINSLKIKVHYKSDRKLNASYTLFGSFNNFLEIAIVSFKTGLAHTGLGRPLIYELEKISSGKSAEPAPQVTYNPKSVARYRENIENMILIAKKHKIGIGVFLQPIMGVDGKQYTPNELGNPVNDIAVRAPFYADASTMFEAVKKEYAEAGAVCVEDISRVFSDIHETVYEDTGHVGRRGNEIISEKIVRKLIDCQLVK